MRWADNARPWPSVSFASLQPFEADHRDRRGGYSIASSLGFTTLMSLGGPCGAAVGYFLADRLPRRAAPTAGFLAATAAMERVYAAIREAGSSAPVVDQLYDFGRFNKLIGFEEIWAFDRAHAD